MDILEIVSLSIVSLVIFIFIYRYYLKPQKKVISSFNTGSKSALTGYCVPDNGKGMYHSCAATYSMDIKIDKYKNKNSHIFTVGNFDGAPGGAGADGAYSVKPSVYGCSYFDNENILDETTRDNNNRLTILLEKDINNLLIKSNMLQEPFVRIKNISLQEWLNISVVFDIFNGSGTIEIYINGNLRETYIIKQKNMCPETNNLKMYATQQNGFNGYIRNVQYIPDALESKQIKRLFTNSGNGIRDTVFKSASNAINYLFELPGKYLYNYDNGSCV